jgi:hypothetical protein
VESHAKFRRLKDLALKAESLESYTDRQLIELAKRLEDFKLLEREPIKVGGQTAVELRATWKGGDRIVVQQQVIVMQPNKQVVLHFAEDSQT